MVEKETSMRGSSESVQNENIVSMKESKFLEASSAIVVETLPKDGDFENDSKNVTAAAVSSELHVSVQRPIDPNKIILPRNSQHLPSTFSGLLGITSLLHDEAEFISNKEVTFSSPSSVLASAPIPPPLERLLSRKHFFSTQAKPSPPPPPPPLSSSTSTFPLPQPLTSSPPPPPPPSPLTSTSPLPPLPPPPPPQPPLSPSTSTSSPPLSPSTSTSPPPPPLPLSISTSPPPPPLPPSISTPPPPPPPPLPPSMSTSHLPPLPPPLSPSIFTPLPPPPSPLLSSNSPPQLQPSTSSLPSPPRPPSIFSSPPPPPPLPPTNSPHPPPSSTSFPPLPQPPLPPAIRPLPPPPLHQLSLLLSSSPPSNPSTVQNPSENPPPPPAPLIVASSSTVCQDFSLLQAKKTATTKNIPPPPAPLLNGLSRASCASVHLHSSVSNGNIPPSSLGTKGKLQSRTSTKVQTQSKKTSLKPYHWLKLTRAIQGSLWAEAQKPEEASKAPELDMSELESLFSISLNSDLGGANGKTNRRGSGIKTEKVHLIELRRAYNCEIMLTKVKVPLSDLMNSLLALDDSALDIDQVDNLIKFCPTKEETELLKNYNGEKEKLGKCEQFFLELIKVPRVDSKLRVFSFKIQFWSQVSDLRNSLNIVNSASEEVRSSVKLKRILQTILSLGNALNHGTARGSAIGFRLDSLPKLVDTRACNNKLTLMHYLCKVLSEKLPEVLDFWKDLTNLEAATKIQLKYLAEEMQAISKGLEKVVKELTASKNDGPVSEHFCQTLKEFLGSAEAEVRSLASLYSEVGKNVDALTLYFGEDPARCPFEQVVSTLVNFVRMFTRAHEENCKQLEFEKKKAQRETSKKKASEKDLENKNVKASVFLQSQR